MMTTHTPSSSSFSAKLVAGTCCLVAFAALTGCGKKEDGQVVGQGSSSSMGSSDRAARDAKSSADTAAKNAVNSTVVTTPNNTAIVTTNTSATTSQAMGNTVDDIAITASISAAFAKDSDLSAIRIDVDTKNGVVSLMGPAPSATARDKATTIAKGVKGVVSVDNKLVVKGS